MTLADDVLAGDRRALARALTFVERAAPEAREILAALYSATGRAHLVGITGAPGAGKSTLINALAAQLRSSGDTVAGLRLKSYFSTSALELMPLERGNCMYSRTIRLSINSWRAESVALINHRKLLALYGWECQRLPEDVTTWREAGQENEVRSNETIQNCVRYTCEGHMSRSQLRVLIAKPGLDGHDRGAKVIARALRDAGMEVIYTGLRQTPDMIVEAALQEDVDAVGLSVLSGAHNVLVPAVLQALRARGLGDVPVFVGGIIPEEDAAALRAQGVSAVFGPGTSTTEIIRVMQSVAAARPPVS